jgi:Holliday junction resolvase
MKSDAQKRGARNRTRGFDLEREVVKAAAAFGIKAERCWASDGRSRGLTKDVDVIIHAGAETPLQFQCKRKKALPAYMDFGNCRGVIVRQDRKEALVLITLEEYLALLGQLSGNTR